jgi:hypothetical protein
LTTVSWRRSCTPLWPQSLPTIWSLSRGSGGWSLRTSVPGAAAGAGRTIAPIGSDGKSAFL